MPEPQDSQASPFLISELRDPGLLRTEACIDGVWAKAEGSARFAVRDPASGRLLAEVANVGVAETRRAIAAAELVLPAWKTLPAAERSQILKAWHEEILQHADDLALLMCREQGKPLAEARGEVAYAASFVEWFAEEAKRIYGDVIPSPGGDRRILVLKEAIGVVAAITPWNFPLAMITRKVAPALAVGCTVVVKPAEDTPLSALALAELARRAGLPPGAFSVLPTLDAPAVGGELCRHPAVRKITFTGSTEVGKILMRQAADTVKKVSLELGGNAPFLVFDDADLKAAVAGAVACKYRNAGQTCVCANRFYVQEGIVGEFVAALAEATRKLRVGPGAKGGVDVGPLIHGEAVQKVEDLLAEATASGARVATGGGRHELGGCFFEPTVLTGAKASMAIHEEEIFGPVAVIYPFAEEEEVISLANSTPYGLAAYLYTREMGRILRVSEALEFGIVGVNTGLISTEVAPFGGVKQSGIGREGSKYGVEDFLEIKYLCLGGIETR